MEGSVGVYLDTQLVRNLERYYMAVAPENMKFCALRVEEVTVLFLVRGLETKAGWRGTAYLQSKQLRD